MTARTTGLAGDERGAVLVPALVMGALMAGALFYVAAVGDAIVFRSGMQDAADVTAFTSAVWHARGMNAIAALNILMSLAVAVFAALRIAEVVVFLLTLIPVVGELGPAEALAELVAAEPRVFEAVNASLRVLELAEEAVSASVPYAAFAFAKGTATAAEGITPFSFGLTPPALDAAMGVHPRRPERMPGALPVQAGEFGLLCAKAVDFLPTQLSELVRRSHLPLADTFASVADGIIHPLIQKPFSLGDGLFCQPLEGVVSSLVDLLVDPACDRVQRASDEAADARSAEAESEPGAPTAADAPAPRKRGAASRKPKHPKVDCTQRGDHDVAAKAKVGAFSARPSVAWEAFANGDVFAHTWSWSRGAPPLLAGLERGMALADRGRAPRVTPSRGGSATAEFYFDCDETWEDHCKDASSWSPSWTARLRRYRSPGEELLGLGLAQPTALLDDLGASVGERVTDLVGDFLHEKTGVSADNALARWIGEQVERIPVVRAISGGLADAVTDLRESTGLDELLDPRNYANPDRIH